MRNPWIDLPRQPPYLLPADASVFDRHPRIAANIRFDLLPAPFMGRPDAAVVLLALNPGAKTNYDAYGAAFVEACRAEMLFQSRVPFGAMNPAHSMTPGYGYWNARLRRLCEHVGRSVLLQQLLCVQFFPYQSQEFRALPEHLPSQRFGFDLVRRAVSEGRLVIVLRSLRLWQTAVPELGNADIIGLRSPRSPYLTANNMGDENFRRVVERLREASQTKTLGPRHR